MWRNWNLSLLVGMETVPLPWESRQFLKRSNTELPCDLASPRLGVYGVNPRGININLHTNSYTKVHGNIIHGSQGETTPSSSNG